MCIHESASSLNRGTEVKPGCFLRSVVSSRYVDGCMWEPPRGAAGIANPTVSSVFILLRGTFVAQATLQDMRPPRSP